MEGKDFIEGLRRTLQKTAPEKRITNRQIADYLGMTNVAVQGWLKRKQVTARQIVGVVKKAKDQAVKHAETQAIRPIVEFFPIDAVSSRDNARFEVFGTQENSKEHPYRKGLRAELAVHHGIYVFHDSRGRALYTGKARRLKLWGEINNAFNRDRSVQKIRRVNHPERRQTFRTSEEKGRQIRLLTVPLHDLAHYLSAYHVTDGLIDELESLLIRSFPNDLLNVRMEKFAAPTKRRKKKRAN